MDAAEVAPRSFPDLPMEMKLKLIELGGGGNDFVNRISVVCKTWKEAVKDLRWRTYTCTAVEDAQKLKALLDKLIASPEKAINVHHLRFLCGERKVDRGPTFLDVQWLSDIVRCLPSCECLTLSHVKWCGVGELNRPGHSDSGPLVQKTWQNIVLHALTMTTVNPLAELSLIMASVQTLTCGHTIDLTRTGDRDTEAVTNDNAIATIHTTVDKYITDMMYDPWDVCDGPPAIKLPVPLNVRSLTLFNIPPESTYLAQQHVNAMATTLRHLDVGWVKRCSLFEMQASLYQLSLADCHRLQTLTLSLPSSDDAHRAPGLAAFLRQVPESLEELTIHLRGWGDTIFNWKTISEALNGMTVLRTVRLMAPKGDRYGHAMRTLRLVCEPRGIHIAEESVDDTLGDDEEDSEDRYL
ncbi:hypothetical protein BC629DRAFT_72553 [Irpex lacteus]|nr:hypothetical protein BC629DRAFT_72553 [Irpex lacteus]